MNNVFFNSRKLISIAVIGMIFGIIGIVLALYDNDLFIIPSMICTFMPLLFVKNYESEEKKYYKNRN